jgi:hypothetical protein
MQGTNFPGPGERREFIDTARPTSPRCRFPTLKNAMEDDMRFRHSSREDAKTTASASSNDDIAKRANRVGR